MSDFVPREGNSIGKIYPPKTAVSVSLNKEYVLVSRFLFLKTKVTSNFIIDWGNAN